MHHSWLDDALRALEGASPRAGFTERVLAETQSRAAQRSRRLRLAWVSSSLAATAAAMAMLLIAPTPREDVTAEELAALRAELASLRAELPPRTLEVGSESGELRVDVEALLSASAEWPDDDRALEELWVVEGGQL